MAARNQPSKGGKPDKLMRDSLMIALNREAEGADGQKTKYMNVIAQKLVELAAGGDVPSIKEINDRIDGKAVQGVDITAPEGVGLMAVLVPLKSGD